MNKGIRIAIGAAAIGLATAATGAPAPIAVAGAPVCYALAGMDITSQNLVPPTFADGVTGERTDSKVSTLSVDRAHMPQKLLTSVSVTHGQVFVTKAGNRVSIGELTLRFMQDGKVLFRVEKGNAKLGYHQVVSPESEALLNATMARPGRKIDLSYTDASGEELLRFETDTTEFSSILSGCKPTS